MPGSPNLHRNASNSVISWHLLCFQIPQGPPSNICHCPRPAVAIMTDCNGGILMRVSSSQRYLEDAKDMQDPAVAVARRGKCPIPGKPEARAATTTIPAHSAVSVDSPVITDDTEPNATAASNVNVPDPAPVELPLVTHTDAPALSHMSIPLDINGNISAPSGSAFNPFVTAESSALQVHAGGGTQSFNGIQFSPFAPMNNFPPTYQPQNPLSSRSVSAPQLRQPYGYGDLMSAYQGTLQPDSLGSSSFDAQHSYGPSQQSYGPSQQSYGPSQQSHTSHTGPDIWRVSTGSNFPP
ncbi:hypothetical protein BS47DRAFT_1335334 [Hydnum rufescens UP504]|uniref:Uncharacterized protein n=1 Tax=Hydnum rufescens UP504 TaxID=1448309 RepID=A0A9P6E2H2_9AGAM|nr:hypothetical protein BS47DRAFT_1335334 [Hydnum rufescens UP504]